MRIDKKSGETIDKSVAIFIKKDPKGKRSFEGEYLTVSKCRVILIIIEYLPTQRIFIISAEKQNLGKH